jgi:phosphatidylethanolamine/phosphatidyl-N-methylethanolamine N-methyltransferase
MAETLLDGTEELDFDRETVERAYDRWAPVYDLVFGGVFSKGRKAAIQATNRLGGRVLEVGVGTGISLPQYAPHLRIFGTDISEAMLRKAKDRVADGRRLRRLLGFHQASGLRDVTCHYDAVTCRTSNRYRLMPTWRES